MLSNTFTGSGIDDIGMHLLDSHVPLLPPPKEHKEIAVDPKIFDGYVGQYQLAPNFILTVTREGDQLFTKAQQFIRRASAISSSRSSMRRLPSRPMPTGAPPA